MVESEFLPCHTCMHCKAKRTGPGHLGVELHRNAAQPLALVCGDLAGPMRTLGIDGNRFAFVLVDVYTSMVWTLPLKAKSAAPEQFKKWLIKVNADSPALYNVRRFHSDNGGEFTSESFGSVCLDFKITQTFSNADEPRQNPYAERAIGTLNSLALTSMTTGNMPMSLWWRAQSNASTVLNAFPKQGETVSPYGLYYQQVPDMSLLAPFGCYIVGYRAKKLNSVDPKWHPGSIKGTYIRSCSLKEKVGYALMTEDWSVYYCV